LIVPPAETVTKLPYAKPGESYSLRAHFIFGAHVLSDDATLDIQGISSQRHDPVEGHDRRHFRMQVRAWLARHPRWTFHFTPTSASWLNAVEGFFAKLCHYYLREARLLAVARVVLRHALMSQTTITFDIVVSAPRHGI
jgi:hypothetical protein